MQVDVEARQVPSLVQLCQRVAATHVDRICSVGDGFRFDIIKPILQNCSADSLLRIEQASPYLESETSDIWKALCYRSFPLAAEQRSSHDDPDFWRDEYFILRELEAKRLDELGSRLRTQREVAEQRKKETQIKITDKVPPQKRTRGWGNAQPKTLFQKTKSDAAKVQKGIYGMRMIPPMPTPRSQTHRVARNTPSANMVPTRPSSASSSGSRITVATVTIQRPSSTMSKLSSSKSTPSETPVISSAVPSTAGTVSSPDVKQKHTLSMLTSVKTPHSPLEEYSVPSKPPLSKKDPTTALFMPKHRAYSQLSAQSLPGVRSRS